MVIDYYLNTFVYMIKHCLEIYKLLPVLHVFERKKEQLAQQKLSARWRQALALRQSVLKPVMILQLNCSNVLKNLRIICLGCSICFLLSIVVFCKLSPQSCLKFKSHDRPLLKWNLISIKLRKIKRSDQTDCGFRIGTWMSTLMLKITNYH